MYRYNCSMQEQHRGGRVSSLRCFEDLAGQSWQMRSSESDRLPWSDGLDWRPPKVPFEQCFRNCKCHYGARTRYKRWYLKWTGIKKVLTIESFAVDIKLLTSSGQSRQVVWKSESQNKSGNLKLNCSRTPFFSVIRLDTISMGTSFMELYWLMIFEHFSYRSSAFNYSSLPPQCKSSSVSYS